MRTPNERPVIYTSEGNLFEDECEMFIEWVFSDMPNSITFVKHVHFQGKEVKREPHVCILKGLSTEATIPTEESSHG